MWFQHLVDLFEHLGDAQIGGFGNRGREIAPELAQHFFIVGFAGADLIKLIFQIGCKIIADIFAEIIGEESCHQPPLVLRDQAVLVLFDITAILNGGHDRGIG